MNKLYGNAIVGQSGGPTAAINATLAGVIKGALDSEYIGKIYGAFNGVEGILEQRLCVLNDVIKSEYDLETLSATPAAALGSCRKKLPKKSDENYKEVFEKLFSIFKKYDIRYFFYIGGNDSMDTVAKLSEYAKSADYEMRIMGVPKTIDNDVMGTDHTPGYGSAAKYIATSIAEMIRDCGVYSVKAVTIVEIMGRDAGWLTAAAALPSKSCGICPDLIYLPERVFDFDKFYSDVEKALAKHPNVVIAVSEGVKCADGTYVGESAQSGSVDVFGHKYLSGTGKALEIAVKNKFGCKVRSVELNILQRCASHIASLTDINESNGVGFAAVKNAENGESGKMMCIRRVENNPYRVDFYAEDIEKIANLVKTVPDEYINAEGNGITEAGIDYMLPLIKGELNPEYKDGLPVHFVIER